MGWGIRLKLRIAQLRLSQSIRLMQNLIIGAEGTNGPGEGRSPIPYILVRRICLKTKLYCILEDKCIKSHRTGGYSSIHPCPRLGETPTHSTK